MIEEWREVGGFEREYNVSNYGRVYSHKSKTFMVGSVTPAGYRKVSLSTKGKRINQYVHRLVAKSFVPNPDLLPQVNHIDGIKTSNCAENLEWTTAQGNIDHSIRTGLYAAGIERWKALGKPGNSTPCRPVLAITSKKIEIYPSICEAARVNGFSQPFVTLATNGRKPTAYGRVWIAI